MQLPTAFLRRFDFRWWAVHTRPHTRLHALPLTFPVFSRLLIFPMRPLLQAKAAGADIVELRIDFLEKFSPETDLLRLVGIQQSIEAPIIVTYRPAWEG